MSSTSRGIFFLPVFPLIYYMEFYINRGREQEAIDLLVSKYGLISTAKTNEDIEEGIDGWLDNTPIDIKASETDYFCLTILRKNSYGFRLPHYLCNPKIVVYIVNFKKNLIISVNYNQLNNLITDLKKLETFSFTDKNNQTQFAVKFPVEDRYCKIIDRIF